MFDIRLFGTTTVRSTTTEVVGSQLGGIKPRQVLELLALAGEAPVTKDRLVHVLWGDRLPASPVPTLESYVSVLRRSVGADDIPIRVEVHGLVELLRDTLARMPDVDVVTVDRALAQVTGQALGLP